MQTERSEDFGKTASPVFPVFCVKLNMLELPSTVSQTILPAR